MRARPALRCPLSCSLLALAACVATPPEERTWPVLELGFPTAPAFDYAPMRAQAHAALPLFDAQQGRFAGPSRVWLKGSAELASASVAGGPAIALEPPYWCAMAEAPAGPVTVEFRDPRGVAPPSRVAVVVPSAAELDAPRQRFSLLAYACFDPFGVYGERPDVYAGDGTDAPGEKPDHPSRVLAIRRALADAARGALPGFPDPDLVLGAGDQVYVEAGHDAWASCGARHPMSAWTVEARPRPRIGLGAFVPFLDQDYRSTWSFTTLDAVLRTTPAVMVWDDHEIRDGWGSQGDEHVWRDTYYAAAREAFVQHQLLRGPRPWHGETAEPTRPLHQCLALHGLPIFVMDQRSARDVRVPCVLGEEQWGALTRWIEALDPAASPTYVLVSPLPILYRLSNLAELAEAFDEEVADDVLDSWSSVANEDELDRLMALLLSGARRGLRAVIVSGDMHLSGFLRATWIDAGGAEHPFAYEVVASGLAGELGGGAFKNLIGREGFLSEDPVSIGDQRVLLSLAFAESSPNFAGLELDGDEVVCHVVQAREDGTVHYRIPLRWEAGAGELDELVGEPRHL